MTKVYNNEERLVKENTPLVVFIANKFRPNGISYYQWQQLREDYVQVGLIGLLKAIRAHKPKSGCLTTLAWTCIWREIIRHIKAEEKHKSSSLVSDVSTTSMENVAETLPSSTPDIEKISPRATTLAQRR